MFPLGQAVHKSGPKSLKVEKYNHWLQIELRSYQSAMTELWIFEYAGVTGGFV